MLITIAGYCWVCRQPLHYDNKGICSICIRHLPLQKNRCPTCLYPSTHSMILCGRCLKSPPQWKQMLTVADYRPPLNKLLHLYKYHPRPQIALCLARLFLLRWLSHRRENIVHKPDRIISVPLHRYRRWHRGFDQVSVIAKPLATWLNCPYQSDTLIRTRATLVQSHLSARQRQQNLDHAFVLNNTVLVSGKNLALIDDVITTGATLNAIVPLLIRAGARSVEVWAICRTL
ncbi:phosphoribosyltransferase family protein [Proteus hauseri ATCC 700826]|uniref:Phosphoribosyltransferase family protein n=1 Tax=Proteus hauseri ATCC 700826 TaxID=1354271 RepID=A0AAJ3HVF0_PROHU|nr:DNA utilization protein GntX [Proteus hauseri]OAT51077.1 phosphoribosyltransferase family protein [Proteus hauseri ATCC 700826]